MDVRFNQLRVYTRGGTRSPMLIMIEVDGRRITPFEQKVKGIKIPFAFIMKLAYRGAPPVSELLQTTNYFLKSV